MSTLLATCLVLIKEVIIIEIETVLKSDGLSDVHRKKQMCN